MLKMLMRSIQVRGNCEEREKNDGCQACKKVQGSQQDKGGSLGLSWEEGQLSTPAGRKERQVQVYGGGQVQWQEA